MSMSLSEIALLLCVGSLFGLGVRYFLALDMRPHTAIYLGVFVVAVGPWLVDHLAWVTTDWSPGRILAAAAVAILVIGFVPALFAQLKNRSRHQHQHHRQPLRRGR